MGGWRQEDVAALLETAVARYARRGKGSTESSAALLDLVSGWGKISFRARVMLSRYVAAELSPPSIDVTLAQEEIQRKIQLGELHHRESREVRETLALRSLAGNMSSHRTRDYKPYLTGVGAAHRGFCSHCGGRVEAGNVWLVHGSPERWHEDCLEVVA